MYAFIYIHIYLQKYTCMHLHICICVYTHVCILSHVYTSYTCIVCMYSKYVYIHMYVKANISFES